MWNSMQKAPDWWRRELPIVICLIATYGVVCTLQLLLTESHRWWHTSAFLDNLWRHCHLILITGWIMFGTKAFEQPKQIIIYWLSVLKNIRFKINTQFRSFHWSVTIFTHIGGDKINLYLAEKWYFQYHRYGLCDTMLQRMTDKKPDKWTDGRTDRQTYGLIGSYTSILALYRILAPAPAGIRHFFQIRQKSRPAPAKKPTGAG